MPNQSLRVRLAALSRTLAGLLSHRAVGDTGALAAAKYSGAAVGLVTAAVAARWLGPEPFGYAVLAISYCDLLTSLVSFKSVSVATHYLSAFGTSGKTQQAAAVFKLSVVTDVGSGTLAALLALSTAPWLVPRLFPDAPIETLVLTFALSMPFAGLLGASTAGLSASGRFRTLAVTTIAERATTLLLVVVSLVSGLGAWGYLLARMVGRSVFNLILLWQAGRALEQTGLGRWWRAPLGSVSHLRAELGAFFGWNYVSVTCNGLMEQVPLMLLGRFVGSADAGYFSLGRALVNVTSYLEATLGQVTYPTLSAWSETLDRRTSALRAWLWSWRAGLPVAVLILAGMLLLPYAIPLALGSDYVPMVGGAQILLFGPAATVIVFWIQPFYYANGRIGQWTRYQVVDTLLVLTLMPFVVPASGWIGLCWLVTVNRTLFRAVMAWSIRRSP